MAEKERGKKNVRRRETEGKERQKKSGGRMIQNEREKKETQRRKKE